MITHNEYKITHNEYKIRNRITMIIILIISKVIINEFQLMMS